MKQSSSRVGNVENRRSQVRSGGICELLNLSVRLGGAGVVWYSQRSNDGRLGMPISCPVLSRSCGEGPAKLGVGQCGHQ